MEAWFAPNQMKHLPNPWHGSLLDLSSRSWLWTQKAHLSHLSQKAVTLCAGFSTAHSTASHCGFRTLEQSNSELWWVFRITIGNVENSIKVTVIITTIPTKSVMYIKHICSAKRYCSYAQLHVRWNNKRTIS